MCFRYAKSPGTVLSCRGFGYVCSGDVLLSLILSGAVPSPCKALASGFVMGPGVSPWPWSPQIFNSTSHQPGVGDGTVAVRGPDGGRDVLTFCDPSALFTAVWVGSRSVLMLPRKGGYVIAFSPFVPVGSTRRGASTSGLSTTCSSWGVSRPGGLIESLSWSRLPA